MISNAWNVPVPLLIDDEYLNIEGEGVQPPAVPSRMGLFVSSCKLFEILHDVLSTFYAGDAGTRNAKQIETEILPQEIIENVLSYNRRLDSFKKSIPEYLRTERTSHITVSSKNSCINLQQQVLYCRYIEFRGL